MFLTKTKSVIIFTLFSALLQSCTNSVSSDVPVPDTTPPVITLGSKIDTVYLGERWQSPPASASDNVDQNLTSQVKINGEVSTGKAGIYKIIYSVSDKATNVTSDTLTVHVVLDPSTVAWYPFDGHSKDLSGNNLHGSYIGKDSLATDRFGNARSAYKFDGSSYVNVPYNATLDFTGSFTISVWARSDVPIETYGNTAGKDAFVIDMGFGAERDYGIYLSSTGKCINFRYNNFNVSGNSATDIQKWHHYAMVFTGDSLKGYIDGTLAGSMKTGVGSIDDKPLRIGCESKNENRLWRGTIDDVFVIKAAYSPSRIMDLAQIGSIVSDTIKQDTTKQDTTKQDTVKTVSNVKSAVTGTSGNLTLTLSWEAVPNASAYGVYYNSGKTVTKGDYYRIAVSNKKVFTTELTEGGEYTFAVVYINDSEIESALSLPVTVVFKP